MLSIYKKLNGIGGEGVANISGGNDDIDKDLTQLCGLPIFQTLLGALEVDEFRILGYPLRFAYYLNRYAYVRRETHVLPDASGPYVFVSYARSDTILMHDQLAVLDELGVRVWWDRDLRTDGDFESQLADKISRASAVLLCISPDAIASKFVTREANYAARHQIPRISSRSATPSCRRTGIWYMARRIASAIFYTPRIASRKMFAAQSRRRVSERPTDR